MTFEEEQALTLKYATAMGALTAIQGDLYKRDVRFNRALKALNDAVTAVERASNVLVDCYEEQKRG